MNIFAFALGFILDLVDKNRKLVGLFISNPDKLNDGDISLIYWIMSLGISIIVLIIYLIGGLFTIRNPKLYCKLYNESKKTFIIFICLITMTLIMKFYNIAVILIEYLIYNISILHLQSIIKVRLSNDNEIVNYIKTGQSFARLEKYPHLEVSINQDMDGSEYADL